MTLPQQLDALAAHLRGGGSLTAADAKTLTQAAEALRLADEIAAKVDSALKSLATEDASNAR